jgi:hypothetical protein
VAQSPGPTEPKWGWLVPLPWTAGQGLAYYRKPFHTHVKGGRWSRLVMPEVGEGRNLVGFDGVFRALVRSSAGALPEFCKF